MTAQELKNSILELAVQGKLVPQIAGEGNARDLLEAIRKERMPHGLDFANAKSGKKRKGGKSLDFPNPCGNIPDDEIPFEIPENWCWCRLGEICSVKGGKRIPAGRSLTDENTGYKYIRVADMKNGSVNLATIKYVPDDIYAKIKNYTISKDDVYITVAGTIGDSGLIPDELDNANLTENADKLVLYCGLDKKFIHYFISSPIIQTQIKDATTKVGQPKLAIVRIQNFLFPLPPLAEQKRIVAKIEELLPYIQKYDEAHTKLQALNKQFPIALQKSILQEAVQGRLVPPACRQAGRLQASIPEAEEGIWFVYVIECVDGSFYKGFTKDLKKRYKEHCDGIGADWTKTHKPKQLFYWEKHYSEKSALAREKYLKSGCGREWFKKEVVDAPENWKSGKDLLEAIRKERARLIKDGKLKKDKPLPPITDDEIPCLPSGKAFEIPENWCWVRFGDIFEHNTGKTQNSSVETKGVLRKFITTSNLYWNEFDFSKVKEMPFSDTELARCTATKGDLLICEGGDYGRSAIWNYDYDVCFQNHIHRARPFLKDSLCIEFYYYVIFLFKNINLIEGRGVGIKSLSTENLHKMFIPLPPFAEQKRIVAKIEELLPLCKKLREEME